MAISIGKVSAGTLSRTGGKMLERVKSLSYSDTVNKLLIDIEADATEGSVKTSAVGNITVENTGD